MDRKLVENVQRLRKEGKSFGEISKRIAMRFPMPHEIWCWD